ncbi:MAG TPA: hypothetical protein DEB40_10415 [Elusimicrobia bacterium]|nr:hypothetical protein [Elusimicrobiota bacterium]HBT62143.1 hypothetical protein [Elusimicrobiota bacterium]
MKNLRLTVLALCGIILSAGCKAPKYAHYTSARGDFRCNVPWAWNVMFDFEGNHFNNTTFIGPFEPDFFLGAPSFSVRWYRRYATHRLRDNSLEMYSSADDFIKQTWAAVYGPDRIMLRPPHEILVAGRRAKHFVVLSAGPASPRARWGTAVDKDTGKSINPRQHAFVVLPMPSGFYVFAYPATRQGFGRYEPQFNQLVNSFVPLTDGPGGAAFLSQAGKKSSR